MKVVNIPEPGIEKLSLLYPAPREDKHIRLHHPQRKIALPTIEGINFEKVQDILWMEASGNYTMLHFKDGHKVLVCKTLQGMEALIENQFQFIRVHRSFTVNLNHIKKYVRGKGGHLVMENGENVIVSSGKKASFLKALTKYFG